MVDVHAPLGRPRPVIFDVDGTLVDSNDAHAHAWVDALKEAGYEVPFARVRPLIGMGGDKLLPILIGLEEDTPEGRHLAERRSAVFRERYLPRVQGLAGAQELVAHLAAKEHPLAVASSARSEELIHLLRCAGVDRLLTRRTSSSDADESKPDPDIVFAALDNLDGDPREAVMIGDTPYDIESARRAGVDTIALRSGGWSDADLEGAVAIYDDPADLRAHYERSPLVRRG